MRSRERVAILALLAALSLGCASAPTSPPAWLPDADAVGQSALGGWVEVECVTEFGDADIHGELLAVDSARVYVLYGDALRAIPIESVREARLTWYNSHGGSVAGWAALGTLTTISNGAFLVFTAPMWMIGGTIAAHSQYHAPVVKSPQKAWDEMRPFARFPQGLPPGFVPGAPVIVETVTEPVIEPEPPPPLPSRRHTEGGTQWGGVFGIGATRYPGADDSGVGFIMGLNVGTKWATAGVRMSVNGRDNTGSIGAAEAIDEATFLDLGLLLGLRAGFGRFELAARAGPAVWGFGIEDFAEFNASFAAQGELFVYPWRSVGIGTVVAYNDNDLLDFFLVTIGIAVGPR